MNRTVPRALTGTLAALATLAVVATTGTPADAADSAAGPARDHTSARSDQTSPAARRTGSTPAARAVDAAGDLLASRPKALHASAQDGFVRQGVESSGGLQYVPYERTYRGLRVVGGDLVVTTDAQGRVLDTSVAQRQPVSLGSIAPQISADRAREVALGRLDAGGAVESAPVLVVVAGETSRLAWSTTVTGTRAGEPSRQTVAVDAVTAKVLDATEHVAEGTGASAYAGTVSLPTTLSGSTYSMTNANASTLRCQNASGNATFTGADDTWGNGDATNRETGCVDAFYASEMERQMLSSWLGRNGMNGNGGWVPMRVGLNDVNAYYDGTQVQIGHTQTGGKWIGSIDVVAHEFGHGVDDTTPGGISGGGTQEFVADTFGAATEWYAGNATDKPDYTVGEQVNLVGTGPIRVMYDPSQVGDSNCYSSSTPSAEVHDAAGPGDHWFYLLAEGSSPTDGQPASPTCNGSSVTGVGIAKAMKIMYNAMLMKTSSSSYTKYRTWTLTAAKNLYAGSCTEFNAVKAAWDAVSVPAQSGDPTCSTGTGGGTTSCTGNVLLNPGFESGAASWTASSGVITTDSGQAARTGSWKAWLDGYGASHTDTLSQSVSIPAGCKARLTFYLHIDSAETVNRADDTLVVKAGSSTLATYSNTNKATGYVLRSFDLSSLAGQNVTIGFTGKEDSSAQTSFVVDDAALTLS